MELTFPKKPFRTHGGARVPHHKNTSQIPTVVLPTPKQVIIPMQQHIGAPCKVLVKKGDHVYLGQKIGDADAFVSAPIHASVSGTVSAVQQVMLPGGQMSDAVVIDSDGLMEADPSIQPPVVNSHEDFTAAVRASGLVGLGGAGFPAHVKLNALGKIDTLIINAAECEPYVTADHREALENSGSVLDGVYAVKKILGVERVIIAVENNKPDVIGILSKIAYDDQRDPENHVRVLALKSRYPQGAEKVLVQACTGRRVPTGKLPADVQERDVIVLDPMLATGGSAIDAINQIKKRQPHSIKFIGIIGAPEGLKALTEAHPDVQVYLAALDEKLNDHAYIIPGLGDAGDRIFGTK